MRVRSTANPGTDDRLRARLCEEIGFQLVAAEPIDPGVIHNNRLIRLVSADNRRLVLKRYYRDDRRRLEREFGSFAFLRARGFDAVPVPYLRDDAEYWAVYSFEPGRTKQPAEMSLDDVAAIGRLAGRLHTFRPGEGDADFPPAFSSAWADRLGFLRRRVTTCLDAATAPDAYPELRAIVSDLELTTRLPHLIDGLPAGLSQYEIERPVPDAHLRFNSGDFAPHNLLVAADGRICAIDFEYFGPEEAAALPASFLAAEQSVGLSDAHAAAFLDAYHAHRDAPDAAFDRYERLRAFFEVSWVLVNLSLMTPAHLARKRFAGELDLEAHLADRAARLRDRLATAEKLLGAF